MNTALRYENPVKEPEEIKERTTMGEPIELEEIKQMVGDSADDMKKDIIDEARPKWEQF